MIKDATIYQVGNASQLLDIDTEAAAFGAEFVECGPTQEFSIGFTPVRGVEHGAWCEYVDGNMFFNVKSEAKQVPSALLARRVNARANEIKEKEGRGVGKAERKEIREEIKMELLPKAFPKQSVTRCYFDRRRELLIIGTTTSSLRDSIAALTVETFGSLALREVYTVVSPESGMANWLLNPRDTEAFYVGREVDLIAADESGQAIKYKNMPLDTEEIAAYIRGGHIPSRLALGFDDTASLIFNPSFQFKKIAIFNVGEKSRDGDDAALDTDRVIYSAAIGHAFDVLVAALGGLKPDEAAQ